MDTLLITAVIDLTKLKEQIESCRKNWTGDLQLTEVLWNIFTNRLKTFPLVLNISTDDIVTHHLGEFDEIAVEMVYTLMGSDQFYGEKGLDYTQDSSSLIMDVEALVQELVEDYSDLLSKATLRELPDARIYSSVLIDANVPAASRIAVYRKDSTSSDVLVDYTRTLVDI